MTKEAKSIVVDQEESLVSQSQHPSKLLVRTYNDDGSTKSILVDDAMSIRDVIFVLVHKNHREPDVDYALVEVLPDLHMGKRSAIDESMLSCNFTPSSSNRENLRRSSEDYRSNSHVANRFIESIIIYQTYGKILRVPIYNSIHGEFDSNRFFHLSNMIFDHSRQEMRRC